MRCAHASLRRYTAVCYEINIMSSDDGGVSDYGGSYGDSDDGDDGWISEDGGGWISEDDGNDSNQSPSDQDGVGRVKALDRRKGVRMTTLVAKMREEAKTKMTRTVKTVEGVATKIILSVT